MKKETKGDFASCPACGSHRIDFSDTVDLDETYESNQLIVECYCLDCAIGYGAVFNFINRVIVKE
jgi:hypothetical protein